MKFELIAFIFGVFVGVLITSIVMGNFVPTGILPSDFESATKLCANNSGVRVIKVYPDSSSIICINDAQFDVKRS